MSEQYLPDAHGTLRSPANFDAEKPYAALVTHFPSWWEIPFGVVAVDEPQYLGDDPVPLLTVATACWQMLRDQMNERSSCKTDVGSLKSQQARN